MIPTKLLQLIDEIKSLQSKVFKDAFIDIRGIEIITVEDAARVLDVDTIDIDLAFKSNPEKFTGSYFYCLNDAEQTGLISRFQYAFTRKGLYMLATMLKSELAVKFTSILISFYSISSDLLNVLNLIGNNLESLIDNNISNPPKETAELRSNS